MRPLVWEERARVRADVYVRPDAIPLTSRHQHMIRACDIILSAIGLVILAPIMFVIAMIVRATAPGPIFFAQRRVGAGGRIFDCYKFRTMRIDAEARLHELLSNDPAARQEWESSHKLRNDPRIVGVGKFMRQSSLDELPQLWNVLRGDMSLVGPRPIVMAEVPRYGRYFSAYCAVRPGITGLWQISARNTCSYRRRVAYDVRFSRGVSLLLYLRILVLTVPAVLLVRGT
ncbi:sugar transferase [Sphingomonas sp. 1P06PA]|uniref:sugar transferase n=1 Tax=Sphingomonas sp. 1P06PA TaxID=554121 RepID=UPI0039A6DE96